jgi:hypothetical protein
MKKDSFGSRFSPVAASSEDGKEFQRSVELK